MIAWLALTLATPPIQSSENDTKLEEIEVIGQKLKGWRARVRQRGDDFECDIKKSTGDVDIDAIGCSAMVKCVTSHHEIMIAAQSKELSRRERRAARKEANASFTDCVMEERDVLIDQLAENRSSGEVE